MGGNGVLLSMVWWSPIFNNHFMSLVRIHLDVCIYIYTTYVYIQTYMTYIYMHTYMQCAMYISTSFYIYIYIYISVYMGLMWIVSMGYVSTSPSRISFSRPRPSRSRRKAGRWSFAASKSLHQKNCHETCHIVMYI